MQINLHIQTLIKHVIWKSNDVMPLGTFVSVLDDRGDNNIKVKISLKSDSRFYIVHQKPFRLEYDNHLTNSFDGFISGNYQLYAYAPGVSLPVTIQSLL